MKVYMLLDNGTGCITDAIGTHALDGLPKGKRVFGCLAEVPKMLADRH